MNRFWRSKETGTIVELLGVQFCPQGGGRMQSPSRRDFEAAFEPLPDDFFKSARRAVVTADWLEPGAYFECLHFGDRWNGWGKPYFEPEVAARIAQSTHYPLHYHYGYDCYYEIYPDVVAPSSDGVPFAEWSRLMSEAGAAVFEATVIEVEEDGKRTSIKVYDFANVGYTWEYPVEPLPHLDAFRAKWPDVGFMRDLVQYGDVMGRFIFVDREGSCITDAFRSQCLRFPKEDLYGLTHEQAEAMLAYNMLEEQRIRGRAA